jgi:predicted RNA binding protein YcfA (HicA-like mRNA interferase family)
MAKRKKKSGGDLNRGPWTSREIIDALRSIGYEQHAGGKHLQLKHPDRPGKVSISPGWSGVAASSMVFNSIARQSGLGKEGLLRVMNGLPPET